MIRRPPTTAGAYIDGSWVLGDGEPFEVINPATEDVLAVVPAITTAQADQAVAAAARAFTSGAWSRVPARERSQLPASRPAHRRG
jgi:acyl-CoA reductase-like NAD-dependent aldehyde dehydrogenase